MNDETHARQKHSSFDFRRLIFNFFNIFCRRKRISPRFQPNKFTQEGRQASRKAYIPLGLYNSSCPLLICCRTNRHGGGNTRGRDVRGRGEIDIATPQGHALRTPASTEVHPLPLILYRKLFRKFRNLFVHRALLSLSLKRKSKTFNCSCYPRLADFSQRNDYV